MARLISPARAYAIASQWGSLTVYDDPGACFYNFRYDDGRPQSEEHRVACLTYGRLLLSDSTISVQDERELRQLVRFLANFELREGTA